jgi:hypothetical protein
MNGLFEFGFFLICLSLGAWVGIICLLSFVVAPVAFRTLKPPPPEFLDKLFGRYYLFWEIFTVLFLVGAGLAFFAAGNALPVVESAIVAGLAVLCGAIGSYSRRVLTPELNAVRGKNGKRFNKLHKRSVRLNSLALFALIGALFLAVRAGGDATTNSGAPETPAAEVAAEE